MKGKKYQDAMSRLEVTPEMAQRIMGHLEEISEESDRITSNESSAGAAADLLSEDLSSNDSVKVDSVNKVGNEEKKEEKKGSGKEKDKKKRWISDFSKKLVYVAAACFLFVLGGFLGMSIGAPASSGDSSYTSSAEQVAMADSDTYSGTEMDGSDGIAQDSLVEDSNEEDGDNTLAVSGRALSGSEEGTADKKGAQISSDYTEGQKLIYTASVRLETEDYDKSTGDLKERISQYKGFLESENETTNSSNYYETTKEGQSDGIRHNDLVIRIPADQYSAFLEGMKTIGVVVSKSQNVDNVTSYYHDTEVQIKALKIQEKRLLTMMEKAETIEDMIAVEERLTDVQSELDSYQTTLKGLDNQIDYATVNVSLNEVKQYSESSEVSFKDKAKRRLAEGFTRFGEGMGSLILGILYLLPVIILLVVLALVARYFISKKKKQN